jgi:pyrophosphatase PpaX
MPRPLAVLFDLDGTLVDTLELLLASARATFTGRAGRVPTEDEWREGIGTPLARQLEPFAAGAADLDALVASYRTYQGEHHDRLTRPYPGAVHAVAVLRERGHPLAIVTSKANSVTHRTLAHVGLDDAFPVVVGSDSCAQHKPHPEPVHTALALLGYAPHEAVFVGDSPHDLHAGRAAGVVTVAAAWGFFGRAVLDEAGADHYLERVDGLPTLIARLGGAARG